MPRKSAKSTHAPKQRNSDIYRFIDFFVRAGEKIIGKKPVIVRGKDGKLVSYALLRLPVSKLETLAVWFLARKKNWTLKYFIISPLSFKNTYRGYQTLREQVGKALFNKRQA